ncbi:hypothetical protein [Staphylococcus sp. GDK8D30P]|uniref:hypothetical protein n=1 Tax=Staphylococcus sp. GDK8D30P TaxID=2804090 RepID=UPI001AEC18E7|nr:hypothetical protein [Staphylococcus sp. GDK8D30P]
MHFLLVVVWLSIPSISGYTVKQQESVSTISSIGTVSGLTIMQSFPVMLIVFSTTNSGFTVTHSVLVVFQPSMPTGS